MHRNVSINEIRSVDLIEAISSVTNYHHQSGHEGMQSHNSNNNSQIISRSTLIIPTTALPFQIEPAFSELLQNPNTGLRLCKGGASQSRLVVAALTSKHHPKHR